MPLKNFDKKKEIENTIIFQTSFWSLFFLCVGTHNLKNIISCKEKMKKVLLLNNFTSQKVKKEEKPVSKNIQQYNIAYVLLFKSLR